MIIYKTFTGYEYKSKKEYDEAMETLLNKPIRDFPYYQLNQYLVEYIPVEKFINKKRDISWEGLFNFIYDNNGSLRIEFTHKCSQANGHYLSIYYQMETNFNINNGFKNYNDMLLRVEYPIPNTILLKDLIKECKKAIIEAIEYWKNNGLTELTNSVNKNFKNISGAKCKNK